MESLESVIRRVLAAQGFDDATQKAAYLLPPDKDITNGLKFDSLDVVEAVMGLEDAFGVFIDDAHIEAGKISTIEKMVDYLKSVQGLKELVEINWDQPNYEHVVIHNDEDEPVPDGLSTESDLWCVAFECSTRLIGLESNLYNDKQEAVEFAECLLSRGIEATVYGLIGI